MDIKNRIKEKLNESLQTKRAKQAGLKHVGHGIYKSNDGHFFRFDTFDGTFYNISLDREESPKIKKSNKEKLNESKELYTKYETVIKPYSKLPFSKLSDIVEHLKNEAKKKNIEFEYTSIFPRGKRSLMGTNKAIKKNIERLEIALEKKYKKVNLFSY